MNVCMLAYSFYESDGRIKRYAETLATRGDHVDVISLKNTSQPSFENIKGVNVYRIQERIPNEKGKLSYFEKLLRFWVRSFLFVSKKHFKNRYKLIHVHSIPDFEVFAAILPKLSGSKVILDIHDIVPEFYMSKFDHMNKGILFKSLVAVEKWSAAFADHVIISNHIWREKILSRSAGRNKCTTILNYPDPSIFYKRLRTRNDHKFIIIYPGTLNWHQGLDLAINAFEVISPQIPEAEFHIYGRGSELDKLKNMVNEKKLQDKIRFLSPMTVENIAELMANADLGVIPKRNDPFGGEAFSTKSLEFMSLGVPLVMSETKIDRYYFNDSVVKFFKPENVDDLASAMLEMIQNEEIRKKLSENALKFVQDFSWERKKQEYLDLVNYLTRED